MKIRKVGAVLELKNSGNLELFFLGTGSAFSKKFYQTNMLAIKGNNHLLIDCGTLCPLAFQDFKSDITFIRNIFLTHSHADHIGGVEEVGFLNYFGTKKRPSLIIDDKYKKILWEDSLRGGMGYSQTNDGHPISFDDYFIQVKPEKVRAGKHIYESVSIGGKKGIDIKIFDTLHSTAKDSRGRGFRSKGLVIDGRILITGDTKFDSGLFKKVYEDFNIEYIFHDCASYKSPVHTSYGELKTLPEEIRNKIFLCHYDDDATKEDAKKDGFMGFVKRGYYYNFEIQS